MARNPITDASGATGEAATTSSRLGIQVISRAASVLRALTTKPRGASLGEIAKAVGLPRSTVQRIVDALDSEGLVVVGASSSGVRLGPGLLPLAASARFEIAEVVRPEIEELARATGETVDLSIFDQDKAIFIDQVQGSHRLRAVSAIGVAFPLHSSSNGKAMLAEMAPDQLARMRRRLRLTSVTENTITGWNQLETELVTIRGSGVAFDREENSLGISAVGTALRSGLGELAAITIPVPSQRFREIEDDLVNRLLASRARMQRLLAGHRWFDAPAHSDGR